MKYARRAYALWVFCVGNFEWIANSIKNGCQNKKIREKVEMPMERMVE